MNIQWQVNGNQKLRLEEVQAHTGDKQSRARKLFELKNAVHKSVSKIDQNDILRSELPEDVQQELVQEWRESLHHQQERDRRKVRDTMDQDLEFDGQTYEEDSHIVRKRGEPDKDRGMER